MLRGCLIGLIIATALPATAQQNEEPKKPEASVEQKAPESGADVARPPAARNARGQTDAQPASLERIAQRLISVLDLTPEQKTQVDQIVAEHKRQREELRKLVSEMIRSPKTEPEKYEALRDQINEMQTKMRDPVAWLCEDIEKVLAPGQAERLKAMREQMTRGGRTPKRSDADLLRELRATLELTPQQSAEFDALLAQGGDAHGQHAQGAGGPSGEELKGLLEELRQAREQRDRERIAELQQKLAGMQTTQQIDWDDFTARLASILTEEQVEKLEAFEVRMEAGGDEATIGEIRDMFRAARRVGLTAEQTQKIRDLQKLIRRKHGRLAVSDDAARQKAVEEIREHLKALLDEQQFRRFEVNLRRLQKRGK